MVATQALRVWVILKAFLRELHLFWKRPVLAWMTFLFWGYRFFVASDGFSRRVGQRHGLTPRASLEIATPMAVLAQVYDYLGDTVLGRPFIDLGCGYGGLLWYVAMTGPSEVIGIEKNPEIAAVARGCAALKVGGRRLFPSCARVHIMSGDACDMLVRVGVYWLGWTGFSEDERSRLIVALSSLPMGAIVVTTTHPIGGGAFLLRHRFRTAFFWGMGTVYVYERA